MTDKEIRIRHWIFQCLHWIIEGIITVGIIGAIIGAIFIDYFWTKSSLEDLSGKEVKPSTVIWTMMKTGDSK